MRFTSFLLMLISVAVVHMCILLHRTYLVMLEVSIDIEVLVYHIWGGVTNAFPFVKECYFCYSPFATLMSSIANLAKVRSV